MKVLYVSLLLVVTAYATETPALKELKSGNLKFSAQVYKELSNDNVGKNFLVCPLSVSVILALAEAGAGGKTAQQFITGLNLPDTEEKIHEAFKAIAPSLNVKGEYTLTSANKIYLKNGYTIKKNFKAIATEVFNAEVSEIDFSKIEDAVKAINKWVLDKTGNKIKDLVSNNDIDANTVAVLINAIYFNAVWSQKFLAKHTTEKPFKISSSKESTVKMMEQTNVFNYAEDASLKAKFLEMKYFGSPISMIIVLPNEVDGLPALESNIETVLEYPKFQFTNVHVQIPHVDIEHNIDFIPILRKLGVQDAFLPTANFSRLLEKVENIQISKVIQKTFIKIEEEGTTAAAATAAFIGFTSGGFLIGPTVEFDANHPFIFILRSPDGILFIGRYTNPA